MRMNKEIKQCCVRLPPDLHAQAKSFAYKHGLTLQAWIARLITDAIEGNETRWDISEKKKEECIRTLPTRK